MTLLTNANQIEQATSNFERAIATYQAIQAAYYRPELNLYNENAPRQAADHNVSYLWPYSGLLSGVNALAALDQNYQAELRRILDGLESYWDESAAIPAYDSYIRAEGGGSKFYDDNEWLGMDFVQAYLTLGEAKYLERAKLIFDFVVSGWTDERGGGIYWQEDQRETKNTCSNGPAAVLALQLYQQTQDEKYLNWAKRILAWVKQLEDPTTGVYWDNIVMASGELDKRTYTYNTGTVLHANALLYQITGEAHYLAEAQRLAATSLAHFADYDGPDGLKIISNSPWFNVVLLRGYAALYQADPQSHPSYLQAIAANVEYAWQFARDGQGLFTTNWTVRADDNDQPRWLLDQGAMVETYALLSHFGSTFEAS